MFSIESETSESSSSSIIKPITEKEKELLELAYDTVPERITKNNTERVFSTLFLTQMACKYPNLESKYVERALNGIRGYLFEYNNYQYDLGPNFANIPAFQIPTIAKNTPSIWDSLNKREKEKLDFIMSVYAYVSSFGTDDDNDYLTGPGLQGNYRKTYNPNYRFTNVLPIIFSYIYFGMNKTEFNQMLEDFSFDEVVSNFEYYGFDTAYERWSVEPADFGGGRHGLTSKQMMENGGKATMQNGNDGGKGVGVHANGSYTYLRHEIDDYKGIFNELLDFNFSGGKCKSKVATNNPDCPYAYIVDETTSPYEGLDGMMREFTSTDSGGIRSSATYTEVDFVCEVSALQSLDILGLYDLSKDTTQELRKRVWVGSNDFLYKYNHGYNSYQLGQDKGVNEVSNKYGYFYWENWWDTNGKNLFSL